MAHTVNMHEAKTTLSKLVSEVERGHEVVIARRGRPVVRLSRVEPEKGAIKRELGFAPGAFTVLPGFDDPIPEFEDPIERPR